MVQEIVPQLQPDGVSTEHRHSILIVDDDRSQLDALTHRLQKQGFLTAVAEKGRQGLAWARENHPDLILLDLRLPDVSGFEVCEQLVDSPETCDIPVIVVSGIERSDVVRSSRAAGCTYFLHKPYDPNALLTLIQHALRRELNDWT